MAYNIVPFPPFFLSFGILRFVLRALQGFSPHVLCSLERTTSKTKPLPLTQRFRRDPWSLLRSSSAPYFLQKSDEVHIPFLPPRSFSWGGLYANIVDRGILPLDLSNRFHRTPPPGQHVGVWVKLKSSFRSERLHIVRKSLEFQFGPYKVILILPFQAYSMDYAGI